MMRRDFPQVTCHSRSSSSAESDDERGNESDDDDNNGPDNSKDPGSSTPRAKPDATSTLPPTHEVNPSLAGVLATSTVPTTAATAAPLPPQAPILHKSPAQTAPNPAKLQSDAMDVLLSSKSIAAFNNEHLADHPPATPEQESKQAPGPSSDNKGSESQQESKEEQDAHEHWRLWIG